MSNSDSSRLTSSSLASIGHPPYRYFAESRSGTMQPNSIGITPHEIRITLGWHHSSFELLMKVTYFNPGQWVSNRRYKGSRRGNITLFELAFALRRVSRNTCRLRSVCTARYSRRSSTSVISIPSILFDVVWISALRVPVRSNYLARGSRVWSRNVGTLGFSGAYETPISHSWGILFTASSRRACWTSLSDIAPRRLREQSLQCYATSSSARGAHVGSCFWNLSDVIGMFSSIRYRILPEWRTLWVSWHRASRTDGVSWRWFHWWFHDR